jgi:hypothetical protein
MQLMWIVFVAIVLFRMGAGAVMREGRRVLLLVLVLVLMLMVERLGAVVPVQPIGFERLVGAAGGLSSRRRKKRRRKRRKRMGRRPRRQSLRGPRR